MSKTIAIITALSLGLVACGSPNSASTDDPNASTAAADVMVSDTAPPAAVDAPLSAPSSKWTYNEVPNEMHGTVSKHAVLVSDNSMDFDFPYGGGSSLDITLMKTKGRPTSVLLHLERGQLLCDTYSHPKIDVKFDDGRVRSFRCVDTSDGDNSFMFIEPEPEFITALKKAKKVLIQPCVFQEGCPIYHFSPEGLEGF